MGQLVRVGVEYRNVHHIFLTHHHFDHIGSLFACLGLNMMTNRREPLTIYGPIGLRAIVDGLCDACNVPNDIGFGVPGQNLPHPRDFTKVVEMAPGDTVEIDEITVTSCENTHYRSEDQFGRDGHISLSYRFGTPDRSVVFTGDTGPCRALERLAKGADLMISEMTDIDRAMKRIRAQNNNVPEERLKKVASHLSKHHVSAEELGIMAERAQVKSVVAVHFAPGMATPDNADGYVARVKAVYSGEFFIGQDLAEY